MTFQSSSGPLHNLYDYLVGKNRKTGAIENTHIAASWYVRGDTRQWTFDLKENVPYYMGGRASDYVVSPEDVRWTWLLQAGFASDRTNNIGRWTSWLNSSRDIVIDGNSVTWNLDIIQPDASVYLSEDWTFGLISKRYWDDIGGEDGYIDHPIGAGAFSFMEYIDNEHFLLERNVDHYRKVPEFHELGFLWSKEPETIIALLYTDDAHIVQVPNYLFDQAESRGFKLAKSTLPSFFLWATIPYYQTRFLQGRSYPQL